MNKKILTMIIAATVAVSTLVGCGDKPLKGSEGNKEKVVITYANWNLGTEEENNLERRMIKEYKDKNPNVDIEIANNIDPKDWVGSLTTAAASGKLPDVIMMPNLPLGLSNEWLLDITQFIEKDEEWNKMAKPVIESTKYGKGTYGIPAGQYFMGYFLNKDLFEKENVKQPKFGLSYNEFENAVKAMTAPSKGILGLGEEVQMVEWYPASINKDLGWFTWDGKKYNLEDNSFKEGVDKAKNIYKSGYVFDGLNDEQKAKFNGTNFDEVWKQSQIALRWEGTWVAKDWESMNFSWEFIGVPGGRTAIVNDYFGISNSTQNAEEAYKFAKWMSFSKEGTLKRIELAKADNLPYSSLPLINDKELLDEYFKFNPIEGLEDAYEKLDDGIVEPLKTVPGYIQSRWDALTGVKVEEKENAKLGDLIWDAHRGNVKIEDYSKQINDLANKKYEEAVNSIKQLTEK